MKENIYKSKILITGASGFIGSHLAKRLLKEGYTDITSTLLPNTSDKYERENCLALKELGIKFVECDIRNIKEVARIVKEKDVIFHLAAISRPMHIEKEEYYRTNLVGTYNFLESIKDKKATKLIHISTVSVLGVSKNGRPLLEEEFQKEKNDYGLSKRYAENLVQIYHNNYDIHSIIIRPCLMYGPGCITRSIVFKAVEMGLFPLINNGAGKIEFCYIDNLIDLVMNSYKNEKAIGQIFNVTDGQSYSLRHILYSIADSLSVKRPFISIPYMLAKTGGIFMEIISKIIGIHPPFSRTAADWMSKDINVYDCSKAIEILNYSPNVSLNDGIRETISWYKKKNIL